MSVSGLHALVQHAVATHLTLHKKNTQEPISCRKLQPGQVITEQVRMSESDSDDDRKKKKTNIKKYLQKRFDETNLRLINVNLELERVVWTLQDNIEYCKPPVPCHYKGPTPDCDCGCNPDSYCGKDCHCDCNPDYDNGDDDTDVDLDKDCTSGDDCTCFLCNSYRQVDADVDVEDEVAVEKVSRVMMASDDDDSDEHSDDNDEDSDDSSDDNDDDSDDNNDDSDDDWTDEDFED